DAFVSFITSFRQNTQLIPHFLVFQAGTGFRGEQLSQEVITRLNWTAGPPIEIVPADPQTIRQVYSTLRLMIGMHYHALVLASLYGVSFVGINHEKKFEDICEDFHMPCIPIRAVSGDQLTIAAQDALKTPIDRQTVDRLKHASQLNFTWLR